MTRTPARQAGTADGDASGRADGPDPGEEDPRAYVQMAWRIPRQIEDGTLPAGRPAPSITRLVQETGHVRQTCAKAYQLLVGMGLLTRWQGLGYYVTTPNRDQAARPPSEATKDTGAPGQNEEPASRTPASPDGDSPAASEPERLAAGHAAIPSSGRRQAGTTACAAPVSGGLCRP